MNKTTAKRYFPFFHWLSTLVLAPFIDALFAPDTKLLISLDNYLVVLASSIVIAFPALFAYFIVYRLAMQKFDSAWQFKILLVVVAGILMLASLEIFSTDLRRDHSLAYGIAIWVTSLFLPVQTAGPAKTRRSHREL